LSDPQPGVQPDPRPAPPAAAPPVVLVPDAGVGVKWFVPQPDSATAARLLDARFEVHVPGYFFTEAASVFQQMVALRGTLTEAEGLECYRALRSVPLTAHDGDALLEAAYHLAVRYKRPVYDSLYLAVALEAGGRVVTADGRLYRGVKGGPLGHLVLWVTDPV
jgi:predicted nucleic acid-binding protein